MKHFSFCSSVQGSGQSPKSSVEVTGGDKSGVCILKISDTMETKEKMYHRCVQLTSGSLSGLSTKRIGEEKHSTPGFVLDYV